MGICATVCTSTIAGFYHRPATLAAKPALGLEEQGSIAGTACHRRLRHCESGEWQGVCLVDCVIYHSRFSGQFGMPLVYLDFIETAPWNWNIPELGQNGTYGACGMILFDRVVERSIHEGFRGRVGLHALPQAEAFYQDKSGMTPLGKGMRPNFAIYGFVCLRWFWKSRLQMRAKSDLTTYTPDEFWRPAHVWSNSLRSENANDS